MNYPELKNFRIECKDDVKTYLKWLVKNRLDYHLDDSPEDIVWNAAVKQPDKQDIKEMRRLTDAMWSVCNPWELFDEDEALWNLYRGY